MYVYASKCIGIKTVSIYLSSTQHHGAPLLRPDLLEKLTGKTFKSKHIVRARGCTLIEHLADKLMGPMSMLQLLGLEPSLP